MGTKGAKREPSVSSYCFCVGAIRRFSWYSRKVFVSEILITPIVDSDFYGNIFRTTKERTMVFPNFQQVKHECKECGNVWFSDRSVLPPHLMMLVFDVSKILDFFKNMKCKSCGSAKVKHEVVSES